MNEIAKESLLFDYYGSLLTAKKQEVMRLYHEDNCSLSEIAEEMGVSRNAIYDALKKAEKQLVSYEEKLGLVGKFLERDEQNEAIRKALTELADSVDEKNRAKVAAILAMLDEAEE